MVRFGILGEDTRLKISIDYDRILLRLKLFLVEIVAANTTIAERLHFSHEQVEEVHNAL